MDRVCDYIGESSFEAFGLKARKLKETDLPLLCKARNQAFIRMNMEDTRLVSVPVLEYWLRKSWAKRSAFPFLVFENEQPCGFIEFKNYDASKRSIEVGTFLLGREFQGRGIGKRIHLLRELILLSLCLDPPPLNIISKVRTSNLRNLNLITSMGFVLCKNNYQFQTFVSSWNSRKEKLRELATQLGYKNDFEVLIEKKRFADNHQKPL